MYISVNQNNEIKKVGVDENLTVLYVDEKSKNYPWNGWSNAKICCYRVNVNDKGIVTMMTPYIFSNNLDVIDQLGNATEVNSSDITDNRNGLMETFETGMTNSDDIATLRNGLMEVYEMITAESEVQ